MKKAFRLGVTVAAMFAVAALAPGCGKDDPPAVEKNSATFDSGTVIGPGEQYGESDVIEISSSGTWSVSVENVTPPDSPQWIMCTPSSGAGDGTVRVSNSVNHGGERIARITVDFGNSEESFTITQKGVANSVTFDGSTELESDETYDGVYLRITSAGKWSVGIGDITPEGAPEWLSVGRDSGTGTADVAVTNTVNDDARPRTAAITVTFEGAEEDSYRFVITQKGRDGSVTFDGGTELDADETYAEAFLRIKSKGSWSVSVTDITPEGTPGWVFVERDSGTGDADVRVTNAANNGNRPRTATIRVAFEKHEESFVISQLGLDNQPRDWTELPAFADGDGISFVAHYTELGGERVRSYSMCYDSGLYGSFWVAYPLHDSYMGSSDRTDAWAYDPALPDAFQFRYHNLGFGSQNYDRGHQLPSADRTATEEMNKQTFYSTNITPQRWRLNQQKWVQLEEWFRSQLNGRDTVWLVTGAHYVEPVARITNRNNPDRQAAVPAAYYKVAVKAKGDSYTGIGFWAENVDTDRMKPVIPFSEAVTIREIEGRTGINFFANTSSGQQAVFETSVTEGDWVWSK